MNSEGMARNYANDRITASKFLTGVKSRYGKGMYFKMLRHLSDCFSEERKVEGIRQALVAEENVAISKTLSWLLRHKGREQGLNIDDEGWCPIEEILSFPQVKKKGLTWERLQDIVKNDVKGRYALMEFEGTWKIRANQGHNKRMKVQMKMKEVRDIPLCVHGTYYRFWESIKKGGLSRMSREHIHFCSGHIDEEHVKSGYREDAQLLIYVDVRKAARAGIKFFESDNGVILCPGDENGCLPPKFFAKVIDRKTNDELADY